VTHVVQFRAATRTFAVLPPTALPFVATIAPVAAIILWRQTTESALLNARKRTWPDTLLGAMHASLVAPTLFWRYGIAAQECINRCRNIFMHQDVIAVDDLHHHVKRWRRLSLQDTLLRASSSRFVVAECHALNPADQVGERWVQHQVVQAIAVCRANDLNATFSDGSRSDRLGLRADLVYDDHLWHVILHRLDHHEVLSLWRAHLHPARLPNRWVWDVTVAGDLIRRIYHHHAL